MIRAIPSHLEAAAAEIRQQLNTVDYLIAKTECIRRSLTELRPVDHQIEQLRKKIRELEDQKHTLKQMANTLERVIMLYTESEMKLIDERPSTLPIIFRRVSFFNFPILYSNDIHIVG